MSRLLQLLLGLSLLVNAFVLVGFVWRTWIEPPSMMRHGPPPPPPPGSRPSPLEALSQDLQLDEGQRQAMKGVFDQYATARRDRFREIQKVREQMVAELQKPEFDMAKLDGLVDQITRLRAELQKENLRSIAELAPKLRPDQQERLHKILADRYGGGWQGRPPPRPPQ